MEEIFDESGGCIASKMGADDAVSIWYHERKACDAPACE